MFEDRLKVYIFISASTFFLCLFVLLYLTINNKKIINSSPSCNIWHSIAFGDEGYILILRYVEERSKIMDIASVTRITKVTVELQFCQFFFK